MNNLEKYLQDCNFEKNYKKLVKKLQNKSVIIYGTGILFDLISKKYDLSELDIIGVSDIKYYPNQEGEKDYGYNIIPYHKLSKQDVDVVLLGVQNYYEIQDELEEEIFNDSPTKVIPLVKRPFLRRLIDFIIE